MNSNSPLREPWLVLFALSTGGVVSVALGVATAHSLGGFAGAVGSALTLQSWQAVLSEKLFWISCAYTLVVTAITLTAAIILALVAVFALGGTLRRGVLGRVLYFPLAVPGTVAALLSYQILGDAGLISRFTFWLGWTHSPTDFPALIFDPAGIGIVLTYLAMISPFFILLFDHQRERSHLDHYMQQARALGASILQTLTCVIVPILAHATAPVIAVYGLALLAAFEVPLLIGAAHPALLSVLIQRRINGFDLDLQPQGYAMATAYLLLLIAAWAVVNWRSTQLQQHA